MRDTFFTSHLLKVLLSSLMSHPSYLLSDANKKPADNLTKPTTLDMDNLFAKTKGISKSVLFNVQQSLLKEWGPDSLGVLPELELAAHLQQKAAQLRCEGLG